MCSTGLRMDVIDVTAGQCATPSMSSLTRLPAGVVRSCRSRQRTSSKTRPSLPATQHDTQSQASHDLAVVRRPKHVQAQQRIRIVNTSLMLASTGLTQHRTTDKGTVLTAAQPVCLVGCRQPRKRRAELIQHLLSQLPLQNIALPCYTESMQVMMTWYLSDGPADCRSGQLKGLNQTLPRFQMLQSHTLQ